MSGNIPAVDGGDVFGVQRMKVLGVIPVIEMASKLFQSVHGTERVFETFRCRLSPNPAKITRCESRKQIQPHVRRRSPVSDDRFRIFLKIIRRKEIVHRTNESFEEAPSAARSQPESRCISGGEGVYIRKARREANPTGDRRRGDPGGDKGGGGG